MLLGLSGLDDLAEAEDAWVSVKLKSYSSHATTNGKNRILNQVDERVGHVSRPGVKQDAVKEKPHVSIEADLLKSFLSVKPRYCLVNSALNANPAASQGRQSRG